MSAAAKRLVSSIPRLCSSYYATRVVSMNAEIQLNQQTPARINRFKNFSTHRSTVLSVVAPVSSQTSSSSMGWIFGTIVTTVLPIIHFKNEFDTMVDTIEDIVDVVENVAEVVDRVSDGIRDDLPEGAKMKKVLNLVGDVAEETAKYAHTFGDVIDEFQDVEDKVENIAQTFSQLQKTQ